MTLRQGSDPYGYKKLLTYKKADELQAACAAFTARVVQRAKWEKWEKREEGDAEEVDSLQSTDDSGRKGGKGKKGVKGWKTIASLQDQMDRSARSVKQNIVEGWMRNSTREYNDFLGFSLGANAELEEDCDDIIRGRYEGVEWEEKRERGTASSPWTLDEVERLPFYPLDTRLPPLIQLKLRCKELNLLIQKLQKSLENKMTADHALPQREMQSRARGREAANDAWLQKEREKWEKGEEGGYGRS